MAIVMIKDHGPGKGVDRIDDSCVVKTKEENDKILERLGEIVARAIIENEMKRRAALRAQAQTFEGADGKDG